MAAVKQYPERLAFRGEKGLGELGLSRANGVITDDDGLLVCAYSGRAHPVYLVEQRRATPEGFVIDYIDRNEKKRYVPRAGMLKRILGAIIRHKIEKKVGPLLIRLEEW